jgi:hypothetical protein
MDNHALRVKILTFYLADANSRGHANFCPCAHLADKLGVSGIDLDNEVDVYGMKPAEGEYRITAQGRDFLARKEGPKDETTVFRRIF